MWKFLCVTSALVLVAACGSNDSSGGGKSPVVFAAMGPNSGSEYNPGPQSTKNQYEALAKAWNAQGGINGHPIKLKFYDTQSSSSVAVQLVSKIRSSHAKAFFSCCFAAESEAVDNALKRTGPVTFNAASPVPTPSGSYIFDAAPPSTVGIQVIEKFIRLKKWGRVALLTDTTPGSDDIRSSFKNGQAQNGYQITSSPVFDVSATSVSTQLAQIAQSRPQAIVVYSVGPQVATVFSGLLASNLANVPVILADGEVNHAIIAKFASSFPKEVYAPAAYYLLAPQNVTGQSHAVLDYFLKAQGFANGENDNVASYLFDDFAVAVQALRHLGPGASNAKIKQYVEHLTGFQGINGTFNFSPNDHHGTAGNQWGVIQIAPKTLKFTPASNPGVTALAK